jgi:hypothetical protein
MNARISRRLEAGIDILGALIENALALSMRVVSPSDLRKPRFAIVARCTLCYQSRRRAFELCKPLHAGVCE